MSSRYVVPVAVAAVVAVEVVVIAMVAVPVVAILAEQGSAGAAGCEGGPEATHSKELEATRSRLEAEGTWTKTSIGGR